MVARLWPPPRLRFPWRGPLLNHLSRGTESRMSDNSERARAERAAFLKMLAGDGELDDHYLEVRAIPPAGAEGRRVTSTFATSLDAALHAVDTAEQQGRNVFAGVVLRDQPSGKAEACAAAHSLWVDLDVGQGKDYADADAARSAVAERVASDDVPAPTLVVHSGGGIHCYWALEEPADVREAGVARAVRETVRGLNTLLLGDNVHDLPRVMRVPGTSNRKPGRGPARILEHHPGRRYALADFAGHRERGANSARLGTEESAEGVSTVGLVICEVEALPQPVAQLVAQHERVRELVYDRPSDGASSTSEGDYALAASLTGRGVGRQDVVDAVMCSRAEAGHTTSRKQGVRILRDVAKLAAERGDSEARAYADLAERLCGAPVSGSLADMQRDVPPLQLLPQAADDTSVAAFLQRPLADLCYLRDGRSSTWLAFEDGTWTNRHAEQRFERAYNTAVSGMHAAAAYLSDDPDPALAKGKQQVSRRGHWRAQATALASTGRQGQVERRLRRMLEVAPEDFDTDPHVLNCANGVLLLHGEGAPRLERWGRGRMMRLQARAPFDPGARSAEWERFLQASYPHEEVRRFLRMAAGLTVWGVVPEKVVIMLWSEESDTGKSLLVDTLATALGSYSRYLPFYTLLRGGRRDSNAHSGALGDVVGKRMLYSTETETGRLDEGVLKNLTGMERTTVRPVGGRSVEFQPQFLMWFTGNQLPEVDYASEAVWSRLYVWHVDPPDLAEVERGKRMRLHEVLKQREHLAAVLAWAARGLADYQANGLIVPQAILDERAAMRAEADTLGQFLEARTERGATGWVAFEQLYSAYTGWCEQMRRLALGPKQFSQAVAKRGYEARRGNGGQRGFGGLRLRRGSDAAI